MPSKKRKSVKKPGDIALRIIDKSAKKAMKSIASKVRKSSKKRK